jgi:mannose-6-phosphate isomerase
MYLDLDKGTALKVFDYSYNYEKVMKECKKTPATAYETNGCKKEILISKEDTPCFSVERYIINNGKTEALQGVCVYVVTDGEGKIISEGYEKELKKGDYFFMPHSCDGKLYVESNTSLTLAKCVPPEV